MRPFRLIVLSLIAAACAGAAVADSMMYLAFDAEGDAARWRTGDVTLAIRKGLLSRRVDMLFRRKGSDLPLLKSDAPFEARALGPILGGADPEDIRLYSVDPRAGAKFMPIACSGVTEKAWVAMTEPRPYHPLKIWVVRWDAAKARPALCVEMDYRYRGQWQFPPRPNRAAEESPYFSQAAH
ncbi:MAG: hypothetical protein K1X35_12520 [Caulobacteraceae bacterium]|nr:hypothetical protein [Caulobacteraceae bacterium]